MRLHEFIAATTVWDTLKPGAKFRWVGTAPEDTEHTGEVLRWIETPSGHALECVTDLLSLNVALPLTYFTDNPGHWAVTPTAN